MKCIKFDGRKDKETLQENNRFETEEHVTIIAEPGSRFIDYISPHNTTGTTQAFELFCLLREFDSVDSIRVAGSDGAKNTTCIWVVKILMLVTETWNEAVQA